MAPNGHESWRYWGGTPLGPSSYRPLGQENGHRENLTFDAACHSILGDAMLRALKAIVISGVVALGGAHAIGPVSAAACVETDGGDCYNTSASVTVGGGCSNGDFVAVAVGDGPGCMGGGNAKSWLVAVGVGGADAQSGAVAVADSSRATHNGTNTSDSLQGAAISGTGCAQSPYVALSLGCAQGGLAAVSGTGSATGGGASVAPAGSATGGLVAVSGTGTASAPVVSISATGPADRNSAVECCGEQVGRVVYGNTEYSRRALEMWQRMLTYDVSAFQACPPMVIGGCAYDLVTTNQNWPLWVANSALGDATDVTAVKIRSVSCNRSRCTVLSTATHRDAYSPPASVASWLQRPDAWPGGVSVSRGTSSWVAGERSRQDVQGVWDITTTFSPSSNSNPCQLAPGVAGVALITLRVNWPTWWMLPGDTDPRWEWAEDTYVGPATCS